MKGSGSLVGYVAIFIMVSMLAMNPQIISTMTSFITGSYDNALKASKEGKMPSYVLKPGQKPDNTQMIYEGGNKTLQYDSSKGLSKNVNYGISINDKASNKKLGKD